MGFVGSNGLGMPVPLVGQHRAQTENRRPGPPGHGHGARGPEQDTGRQLARG